MRTGPKAHKYVSLVSVWMVVCSIAGLVGLSAFLLAFIHRIKNRPEGTWDIINLADTWQSYLFVGCIVLIFVVLLILLIRAIYTLNHPQTVLVTIQYTDKDGNFHQITKEIDDIKEYQKSKNSGERFQKLSMLDKQYPYKEYIDSTDGLNLEYICRRFRSFASNIQGNPLYYSIKDIRRWVAAMGVSKILVLQGMSGTGKTSLPVAWGKFTGVATTVVPVQPMWKERSDLIGYYNEFTGKFNESMILEKLYEANKTDKMFIIVLDEVNIARIEYYFAEFLSLLELPTQDERILEVTTSIARKDPRDLHAGKIILPNNVWFVGTANNDDSTFSISDKVYDRSMVMNLDYRCDPFIGEDDKEPIKISEAVFRRLVNQAKKEFTLTKRGRMHIKDFDKYLKATFGITYGNRIRRQIENYVPVYIACGGNEEEAIDDLLAKKVLRKLEAQNPIFVKSKSEETIAKLNDIFGQDKMVECIAYIRKLTQNV